MCHINAPRSGRYVGILTTRRQFLQLCEVEIFSKGASVLRKAVVELVYTALFFLFPCMADNTSTLHLVDLGKPRTQSPQAFWSVCETRRDNGLHFPRKRVVPVLLRMLKFKRKQ